MATLSDVSGAHNLRPLCGADQTNDFARALLCLGGPGRWIDIAIFFFKAKDEL